MKGRLNLQDKMYYILACLDPSADMTWNRAVFLHDIEYETVRTSHRGQTDKL